jgi:NAD(P)H-dependent FMN reductase
VSGVIKNLLDWLVGLPAFCGKPVAVLNASPRAQHADAALREILRTMSAHVVDRASITLPILGSGIDEDGIVASAALASALRAALAALSEAARTRAAQMPAAPGDEAGSTGRR